MCWKNNLETINGKNNQVTKQFQLKVQLITCSGAFDHITQSSSAAFHYSKYLRSSDPC